VKADIEWVEKLDGGVKRKIRITFLGKGKMKWQTKRSDEDMWDYDTPPSPDDWEALEEKVNALYNRRRTPFKNLELVRQLRKKAGA
jgi:carbonic anhydrase